MGSECFAKYLVSLVERAEVSEARLNEAVAQVLRTKFAAGLFDDPFRWYALRLELDLSTA